ncbi:MAG: twitch domain-containing radical SAM protein [Bacteriovoracia bacterium]
MSSSTLCPLPWIHLATHPVGEVSVCCKSDMQNSIGHAKNDDVLHRMNLAKDSIQNIRNSDSFKKIRLQMLNGEIPTACMGCFDEENKGLRSKRLRETEDYPVELEQLKKITHADGGTDTPLKFLELRLGNRCNLKCITCNPMSSSFWEEDAAVLKNKFGLDLPHDYLGCSSSMFNWPEQEQFWQQFEAHKETIDRIYVNGGEPTLNMKHQDFLKKLIATGRSKEIELLYNINVTNIPDELIAMWGQFKKTIIHASIDDIEDRNDYIRFPSKWQKVEKNFLKLIECGFEIEILQTISCFNFFYLEDFSRWLQELAPNIRITYNYVTSPSHFSPMIIPPSERKKALMQLTGMPRHNVQDALRKYFNDEYLVEDKARFFKIVDATDQLRNTSYKKTFPKLYESLQIQL